jgi:hypothetical protein
MSAHALQWWAAGGQALQASGSKVVDGCCLLISHYSAPGLVASQLLLLPDPDQARSMPLNYWWPGQGGRVQVRCWHAAVQQHTRNHLEMSAAQ